MGRDHGRPAIGPVVARSVRGTARPELATARLLVPHVLAWLRQRRPDALIDTLATWSHDAILALPALLSSQGLAPLVADLLDGVGESEVPATARPVTDWLAGQLRQNRERSRRFADDLTCILAGAAEAGVSVMPLKGSVLAFTRYREPALRPMADLDLLVRPDDERVLHMVLERLGYQLLDAANPRHREFGRPGAAVVAWDGTHPENPRSVEVHTQVRRSAWLERGGVDLAPHLWASGREATLLGEPAWLADDASMLTDVAAHATLHLMRESGTLLQWFDVANLAGELPCVDEAFAQWTFPALALATRAFPHEQMRSHQAHLATHVGASVVRLADHVPLDDRAGLNLRGVSLARLGWWGVRWRQWRPNPWLVRMAHPRLPAAWAYPAYALGVGIHGGFRVARAIRGGK